MAVIAAGVVVAVCLTVRGLWGQTRSAVVEGNRRAEAEIESAPTDRDTVIIRADYSQEWTDENGSIAVLRGRCSLGQGRTQLNADSMVVWRRTETAAGVHRERLSVYAEGRVRLKRPGSTNGDTTMFVEFVTRGNVTNAVHRRLKDRPGTHGALFRRARQRRKKTARRQPIRQTQLLVPAADGSGDQGPALLSVQLQPRNTGVRRVHIVPRSAVAFSVRSFESQQVSPPEQVWVLTGGINMVIDGVQRFGTVDLSADRMVIWTQARGNNDFQNETVQSQDAPFEVYLEGHIVIRQGQNVIHASRATYDAREDRGLILDAELKTFIPAINDVIRIRAERMRQLSRNSFHAQRAWMSTSKFGRPGYRIQASDIFYENRTVAPWIGPQPIDPVTGAPLAEEVPWITSLNNTFYVENVPLMYLPYFSGPAENPHMPLRRFSVGNDRIFGTTVRSAWDLFSLLGIDAPNGTRWDLLADYLSDRGPALGTEGRYKGNELFGITGTFRGEGLIYGILDDGRDNLGLFRQDLRPESNERYRIQWRHRHNLPNGMTMFAELGLLSDRNFLESYYEREFDTRKDVESLFYLKQQIDNFAWTVLGRPQLNAFENTTEWLPRGDLYVLAEPFAGGRVTWSMHASAGYGRLRPADRPADPTDLFSPVPCMAPAS
ncbi:MAG: hypothetical protein IID45_08720, partial [Planctomycetes bacterium]|nr:hypothetical protein [Planctomycetota bacterium]